MGSRRDFDALPRSLHLNLDHAWEENILGLPSLDAVRWGPPLRFSAPRKLVEEFYRAQASRLPPFILYGSGDFHHLTALWIRQQEEPFVLVSFDNHPDWDLRPPHWCCGGWVNRALELPHVRKVIVWGCGNFEPWWPAQIFGNRRAENEGRLELHPWADERSSKEQKRRGAIFRETWRDEFERSLQNFVGANVYVTIDLDCLRREDALTNWENGRFAIDDVAWALRKLRASSRVIGGDICGAYSPPVYARATQKFAAEWDHPKIDSADLARARQVNHATLETLWPILTD